MGLKPSQLNTATKKAATSSAKVTEADKNLAETTAEIESQDPNVGRLSSSVALVGLLGDPSDPDVITEKDADGNKKAQDSKPRVVGYIIKNVGNEPLKYWSSPLAKNWTRKDRMSHIPEETVDAVIAPGETANLTLFETAVLFSTPEVNLVASGGDLVATGVFSKRNSRQATENTDSQNQNFLIRVSPGSIRDMKYTEILTFEERTAEGGGVTRTGHKIIPGFEKFAPIAENRGRRGRTGGSATRAPKAVTHNADARNFLNSVIAGQKK